MRFLIIFTIILSAILISHVANGYNLARYHKNNVPRSLHIVPEGRPIMKHITYWYDTFLPEDNVNEGNGNLVEGPADEAPSDDDEEEPPEDDAEPEEDEPEDDDEEPDDDPGYDEPEEPADPPEEDDYWT